MIDAKKREAIYSLHKEGIGIGEISRIFTVDPKTVRRIIDKKGVMPDTVRKDSINIDPEFLRKLHQRCNGYVQRMHEIITEGENIVISYPTLVKKVNDLGLNRPKKQRCDKVADEPGAEFQHDTTVYKLEIGGKKVKAIASLLYYRYSKVRYLKFYPLFNRFTMKCFFHEALVHLQYVAEICIIDNTNLARLRGSGKNAVIVPEMELFVQQYGFKFVCHAIGHANRKAGNERSFYTVETNFLPGRTFTSWDDLNHQAFEWATVRIFNRAVSKTHIIPAKAFEHEKSFLKKIPSFVPAVYLDHERDIDQYGYVLFRGNYYWIPGTKRHRVKILEYADFIEIYLKRQLLSSYPLPPHGVKNEKFSPKGAPGPRYQPHNRKKSTAVEEKILRDIAPDVDRYLNFAIQWKGKKKHSFIRQLYCLSQKLARTLFIKTINRALKYRINTIETIERIAILYMKRNTKEVSFLQIDEAFQKRESYRHGYFCDEVDLSLYDKMIEEEDTKNE